MYARVVFNRPIPPYTYEIPSGMGSILPGMRVVVELRNKRTVGMVYELTERAEVKNLKPILEVKDSEPVLNDDLLEVAEWISRQYICSVGEACWSIVPKGIRKRNIRIDFGKLDPDENERIVLTEEQRTVFDRLKESIVGKKQEVFLLHGVTGSGKTEIYLRIISEVINLGQGAILLVPEISLTPQTVRYFASRLGNHLAVLHSRLTKAEKINEWYRILSGDKRVVIGARSAIFAPIEKIGIIIIDEEHETSYKSEETPRYNARSIAYYRAKKHGATFLLGSATPSMEAYYLAKQQKMNLLQLSRRVMNQNLPVTKVTDLRKVRGEKYISNPLIKAIEARLKKDEQVILFLNRRGFSPYVYCENCGYVFKCKNCDITLTFHKGKKKLLCHYCGYSLDVPDLCPNCGFEKISFTGFGTQRIEKILNEYFPGAVIVRMDTDSIRRRNSLSKILAAFSRHQIDILIGTQIVTKGLHFPNVTLVGVLNADIPLNFPDFRAAERTFDLITQVAGRAGRGVKKGEVIIQTYNPAHYAIQTAKNHDYEEFFIREIKYRQGLIYPPFCRIIRLVFRGGEVHKLFQNAGLVVDYIREKTEEYITILGPALCPLSRIKSNFRVHVIIKTERIAGLRKILMGANELMKSKHGVYLEIDIDPVSML